MTINWTTLLWALAVLSVGGWALVGALLWGIRLHVTKRRPENCWGRLDFWIGSIERTIATAMFVWGIAYLPAFIGAWVALKLAANWQRIKSERAEVRSGTLIVLIGNVFSFAFAIAVGAIVNPLAIGAFIGKAH